MGRRPRFDLTLEAFIDAQGTRPVYVTFEDPLLTRDYTLRVEGKVWRVERKSAA